MRWVLLAALAGCQFTPGQSSSVTSDDARPDDAPGVVDDVPADTSAPVTCYAKWLDGTIRFGTPVAITAVNSTSYDRDPYLSPDEHTLWLSSGRSGGAGEVWIAKRPSATATFNTPQVDTDFDSANDETKLSITTDGLYAVVGSTRSPSQGVDVWESSRATVSDNWTAMVRTRLGSVNTSGNEHDPTISGDGLRLYLASDSASPQRISVASRATRGDNFGAPVEITELFSNTGDADPSPTPDERILLFASNRGGGPLGGNVWYATRATSTGTFSTPQIVPDVNTDAAEGDPHMSADGCRLYFGRDLGSYNWDIFVATALP